MDARVLHRLTVPINEEMVFLFSIVGTVGFTFSGFPLFFLFLWILNVALMSLKIAELFAGRTFGGATHVARFDLVGSEESVTVVAFAYGTADAFDAFSHVGSLSVGSGVNAMISHTLTSKEGAVTSRALVTRDLPWSKVHASRLMTRVTFLAFTQVMQVIVFLVTGFAIDAKMTCS